MNVSKSVLVTEGRAMQRGSVIFLAVSISVLYIGLQNAVTVVQLSVVVYNLSFFRLSLILLSVV